jgi:hypothetical protein
MESCRSFSAVRELVHACAISEYREMSRIMISYILLHIVLSILYIILCCRTNVTLNSTLL